MKNRLKKILKRLSPFTPVVLKQKIKINTLLIENEAIKQSLEHKLYREFMNSGTLSIMQENRELKKEVQEINKNLKQLERQLKKKN